MIKEIENCEFLENKINNKYKYCFGENQSENRYRRFEINLSPSLNIGIFSDGNSKPQVKIFNNYYFILINNEVNIINILTEELNKSFFLNCYAYDILETKNCIFILGEIDIIVLDYDLNFIKQLELTDILVDYFIDNDKLFYKTMENQNILEFEI